VRLAGSLHTPNQNTLSKAIVIFVWRQRRGWRKHNGRQKEVWKKSNYVALGGAPVSAVARSIGAPIYVSDVGLQQETESIEGVLTHKVVHGTHRGNPAMTEDAAKDAISFGMAVGKSLAAQGVKTVGLGNIGERSLLSALGLTAAIMKEDLEKATAQNGVRLKLGSTAHIAEDPIGTLAAFASAEICALFGLTVQAAREGMAIVFDNAVTGAAVLAAAEVYPEIKNYVFPSAAYDEPVHAMQMQRLGMRPFLHYDFTLAQGLGSALGLSLLDASLDMLNVMKTFGAGGVDVAVDGPGKGRQREDVK